MPTHMPHFPDLLFEPAARLRAWEGILMRLLAEAGYRELHPSLVMREPMEAEAVRFFDGADLVALRWDFTLALARLLASRFDAAPSRISYAGAVFRRPHQPWEPVERFEVGCERIQGPDEDGADADVELARLMVAMPTALGLQGGILQLGHAALLRRPMEAEGLDPERAGRVVRGLHRRAAHRVAAALDGHPAAARLLAHAEALLVEPDGSGKFEALAASPYAGLLEDELAHLRRAQAAIAPLLPPDLELRVDPADVQGIGFYTGPTLRLWAPGAQAELASGGRYDGLYPELGRPWKAAGFCLRLSRLLDLADTRPDLFGKVAP
ncbi:MAG: ATP phosphoribosyltransferase regulatory subunit [Holophagaceae bacterium]|nr:ATP phosphoribosyltransferase regulatory subunit [Holophagaceae bacterium]